MFYVSHQTELQRHFVINAIECSVIEWCEIDFECCIYGRRFFLYSLSSTLIRVLKSTVSYSLALSQHTFSPLLLGSHILVHICVPLRTYIVYQVDRQENMIITVNNERERPAILREENVCWQKRMHLLYAAILGCVLSGAVVDNYGNMSGFRSIIRAHI